MALILGPLGAFFVSGAAQAARFSDCNTGRLAPCRYKVSAIGREPLEAESSQVQKAPVGATGVAKRHEPRRLRVRKTTVWDYVIGSQRHASVAPYGGLPPGCSSAFQGLAPNGTHFGTIGGVFC